MLPRKVITSGRERRTILQLRNISARDDFKEPYLFKSV